MINQLTKKHHMNLEDAANFGELLGGLAILGTLIFGIRQIVELNKTKEKEAARELANIFSSPMYQTGLSLLLNKFPEDITIEEAANFTRAELDAMSYMAYNTNSVAMMTFDKQLSFTTVARFMQPVNIMLGSRLRVFIALVRENAKIRIGVKQEDYQIFDWTIWLLDRMDELPPLNTPANVRFADWRP
tara:strand:+ start:36 stop:599 length:564 start_codon:yes stop_codon:yes gene_type:complete